MGPQKPLLSKHKFVKEKEENSDLSVKGSWMCSLTIPLYFPEAQLGRVIEGDVFPATLVS